MKKWKTTDKAEFETRQGCLEFGNACRFINDLIAAVKREVRQYATNLIKKIAVKNTCEKNDPLQLSLNFLSWMSIKAYAV